MAEIEHFVDPTDKSHPKFADVDNYECTFFSACNQMDGKPAEIMTIGNAVRSVRVLNRFCIFVKLFLENGCKRDAWLFLGTRASIHAKSWN
jgi:glycyl-tRNA synthetase (class II)